VSFRVRRTIQTTIELIIDHEEDAVAVAMEPLSAFVKQVSASGTGENELTDYEWKERGSPSITPTGGEQS
jgi:hypothetical protein